MINKYLSKLAEVSKFLRTQYYDDQMNEDLHARFTPDLSPEEMVNLGVLEGKYTEGDAKKDNYFKVDASMKEWPEKWHNPEHPLGWFQWYQGYAAGKRTADDERQIKRWISFKARHLAQLKNADPTLTDLSVQPRRRQALLNWGIAPGIDKNKILNTLEKSAIVSKIDDIAKYNKFSRRVDDLKERAQQQAFEQAVQPKKKETSKKGKK